MSTLMSILLSLLASASLELNPSPESLGLVRDPGLDAAAMRHAQKLAFSTHKRDRAAVKAELHREGLADPEVLPFSVLGKSPERLSELLREFLVSQVMGQGFTHYGLAITQAPKGGQLVTLWVTRRLVYLSPLPQSLRDRVFYVRGVAPAKMRLQALLLGPCRPDCPDMAEPLEVGRRGTGLWVKLPRLAPGDYTFELIGQTSRGPERVALWPFRRGARPRKPAWKQQGSFVSRLSRARRKRGLPRLRLDQALMRAAKSQAKAVCDADLAAHRLPGGQDPVARARKAGYIGPIAENIAIAQNEEAAHQNLMNSPSHRQNRLNPAYDRYGYAVRHRKASTTQTRAVCVVELFGR